MEQTSLIKLKSDETKKKNGGGHLKENGNYLFKEINKLTNKVFLDECNQDMFKRNKFKLCTKIVPRNVAAIQIARNNVYNNTPRSKLLDKYELNMYEAKYEHERKYGNLCEATTQLK